MAHPPNLLPPSISRPVGPPTCMMTNLRLHLDTIFRKVSQAMSCSGGITSSVVVRQHANGWH